MSTFKRTALIVTVSQLVTFGLPLITFPLLVKTLDITSYGMWVEANTLIGLAIVFAAYGLNNAVGTLIVSQPGQSDAIYSNALYVFLGVCGGIAALIAITAPLLNAITIRQPIGIIIIQILAITVLTNSVNQLCAQVYRLRGQPLRGAIFDIALALSRLVAVLFLMLRRDLTQFAIAFSLLQAVVTVPQLVIAYRGIQLRRLLGPVVRDLIKHGANLAIVSQASWVVMFGDRLMLSILSTSNAVAIYSASYQFTMILIALGAPYSYSLLPELGTHWQAGNIDRFQAAIRRSTRATSIILIPAIVGLTLIGDSLLRLLATKDFAQGGLLIGFIALGVGLDTIGVNLQYIFYAQGRSQLLRRIYIRAAIFNLTANLVAIPVGSYYGAGITTLLTFIFIVFSLWRQTQMPLSTLFDLDALKRCIVAAAVMGIWVSLIIDPSIPRLLLAIAGGAVIYGIGLIVLRIFSISELINFARPGLPRTG